MPTVTAVIPTYNRAKLLVEALASALQQTRPPDEIVVIDDGSKDDTEQVVARYGDKVRYIRQKNAGPSAARNHGIREARGDFVAFLDSDDLWAPDRLERQLAALTAHPQLDFLFGLEAKFTAEKNFDTIEIRDPNVLRQLQAAECVLPDAFGLLLHEDFVPTSSVLFRRKCIEKVGYIDETLHQAEDYDFWIRFAMHGFQFGFINRFLCRRRLHEGNLVNQWANSTASVAEVLSRYRDHLPAERERLQRRLSALYYDLGSHLLYRRDFRKALHYLRQANPTGRKRVVWAAKLAAVRLLGR